MMGRLLFITCAAYLVAAVPARAQNGAGYHDSCGGHSCASDAYDLGYHDGYEGHSYSSSPHSQATPNTMLDFRRGKWTR